MEATEIKNESVETTDATQPTQSTQPIEIPAELNQQQALQVLVDAAKVAQSKGIFTLDDAELVNKAIKAFLPKGPVASQS